MKRKRRNGKDEKNGNHFGGSKAPRTPVSVGEEYIVTIDEMGKDGTGVAKLKGVSKIQTRETRLWLGLQRWDAPMQWLRFLAHN